ncbi:hypothetical protein pneo_cds_197 [Pandoravirus neocaledonia]|uniref:Uncharacterized protein n=1 Tax=Pandoravirus neocaledonia TaxID=2107708 RepID=A0A2U7UBI7_9VIRU|nr:hypothetical protein pneo_cds_197 [Pandoravirus neocaledonia]AVK75804.1 hypothetical protein pneo_cds_197 [Pandoravirus neocaledonia]
MSALQSPFNAGFGLSAAQAMRQPALGAAALAPINSGFVGVSVPGERRQPMNQAPLNPDQSYNLAGAANLNQLMQTRNQYNQQNPLSTQSPSTRSQQAVFVQAAQSQAPRGQQLSNAWAQYVQGSQGQAQGGVRAMNIARSRPGSQRQQPISAGQLSGTAASLLGQPDLMDIAQFGASARPLPAPLQPQSQFAQGFQAAQGQQFPTALEELLAEQQALRQPAAFGAAATAPANLGGVGQLGASAPMAARYRHNSFDGLGAQGYAGSYGAGRSGRRNSMGVGQQNPFAAQSFAGHYGNAAAAGRTNFASHYDDADVYGENGLSNEYARNYAAQYAADSYADDYAGHYGNAARANFAGQYGNGASRQRRSSLGVGNIY